MVPMTQKSTNLYQVKVDGQVVARTTRKVYAEKEPRITRNAPTAGMPGRCCGVPSSALIPCTGVWEDGSGNRRNPETLLPRSG